MSDSGELSRCILFISYKFRRKIAHCMVRALFTWQELYVKESSKLKKKYPDLRSRLTKCPGYCEVNRYLIYSLTLHFFRYVSPLMVKKIFDWLNLINNLYIFNAMFCYYITIWLLYIRLLYFWAWQYLVIYYCFYANISIYL